MVAPRYALDPPPWGSGGQLLPDRTPPRGHKTDTVDAYPSGRARPGEDDASNELRLFLCNHLRDHAAEGEPDEVDLFEAERSDECDCVPRHRLDRVRRRAF